jgi:hypothetical protein
MLALEVLGLRGRAVSFPAGDLTTDLVTRAGVADAEQAVAYEELIAPLRECGRTDLATAVQRELKRFRGELGVRGYAKAFDAHFCGGSLVALRRSLRASDGV